MIDNIIQTSNLQESAHARQYYEVQESDFMCRFEVHFRYNSKELEIHLINGI